MDINEHVPSLTHLASFAKARSLSRATDGECAFAFLYFPDLRLAEVEDALIETAVGLAVRQIDPTALALIINVRQGNVRTIDLGSVLTEQRVDFLRRESVSYRAEWVAAA